MIPSGRTARAAFWAAIFCAVTGLSAALGLFAVVYYQVYFGDTSALKKSAILAKITEETSIYCLDGKTRLGSFFESAHRRYIPIDEVPNNVINALIAAEDKNFYSHHGVDFVAIFQAFLAGLREGHFHRGGSSLTQQTVKNLLDRREHTFKRKFREIIYALQLEQLYTKKQILEFYLNQFHVSGTGNGIGIAAQYYFNKDVKELNLVEAAFIAGSVKGPSKYNPFIKFTKAERDKAKAFAFERKNYVLRRMYEQGWITAAEFKAAWDQPVPFNHGKFGNTEVALVELVRDQLKKKEVLEALNMDSVDEINNAGLNVYTTIDSDLQTDAQLAMRRNLSRLETILSGFKPENPEEYQPLRDLEVNQFYFGKVVDVHPDLKDGWVKLSFGLPEGTIPYESLVRYAKLLDLATGHGWQYQLKDLFAKIKKGDVLFVEVTDWNRQANQATLELEKHPLVNGGLVALDKGEVRVAVSGFDTKGYNRAIEARRQPGSVFKGVLYYAALQLGWNILDSLDNERQVFPYQGRFYYPRPDVDSPFNEVSMLWAGTMSENVASVNLASNLTAKLSFDQFKQVMGSLDLLPRAGESAPDYHYRVARTTGVQLDNEGVREYQLTNAVNDIAPDLVFAGQQDVLRQLRKMWWGRGYAGELAALTKLSGAEWAKERALRIDLIKNNYQRMGALASDLNNDWPIVAKAVSDKGAESALNDPAVARLIHRFKLIPGSKPELGYFGSLGDAEPPSGLLGHALTSSDVQAAWGGGGLLGLFQHNVSLDDVRLSGYLPLSVFANLQKAVDARYQGVMAQQDPYDLPRYYQHHDFRIALGINYLVALTHAMGVTAKLDPVLSYPLGTNVVSVAEVAKLYQTLESGKLYRFYKDGPSNQLNFIRRIEDRDGHVLYAPKPDVKQVALPIYSAEIKEILRNVVLHGTGRRARGELYLPQPPEPGAKPDPQAQALGKNIVRVPAYGKTGTTNDFTTAYFAGFLPYPTAKGAPLETDNSYVIASYVGYDWNKVMRHGRVRVFGNLGALPLWTDFAKRILVRKNYLDYIDPLDLSLLARHEWPVKPDAGTTPVKVDLPHGTVLREDLSEDAAYATTDLARSGESYDEGYSLEPSRKDIVRVPSGGSDGMLVRMVKPFAAEGLTDLNAPVEQAPAGQAAPGDVARTPDKANAAKPDADRKAEAPTPSPGAGGEQHAEAGTSDPADSDTLDLPEPQTAQHDKPKNDKKDKGYVEEDLWKD